ncbi:hypothetical protein DFH09DRAFT_1317737 [Mycena vulgaris]|nr:hypothetical protein DFH09DRAFT_1317737 [Mycena vulgaris]
MHTPYDVAFPAEPGLYVLGWKTTRGEDWFEEGRLGPNYTRLARFIKSVATAGQRTSRTVFGPGGSYFSSSPSGYSWQNLAPALEEDIHNSIRIRRPMTVALGVQGSYVVLYSDGTVTFDLRGQYPLVEALIRNTQEAARRRGVMYIALNPFTAGEYYAVYGDGGASWNFPVAWGPNVTAVSREIKPVVIPAPVVAAAPAVAPGGTGPAPADVAPPVQVALGGTGPAQVVAPVSTGGTSVNVVPSVSQVIQPEAQPTSMGGTSVNTAASVGYAVQAAARPTSMGGTSASTVASVSQAIPQPTSSGGISAVASVGHAIQAAAQESAPPPAYAPAAPIHVVQSLPPTAQPAAAAQKFSWRNGLAMGVKAAQGINKVVDVIQDTTQLVSNVTGGQTVQQPATQSVFDFGSLQGVIQDTTQLVSTVTGGQTVQQPTDTQSTFDFGNLQGVYEEVIVQQTTYDDGTVTSVVDTTTWEAS